MSFLYWLIMLLWLVFGARLGREDLREGRYGLLGGNVLLFVLLFLIGWRVFGSPIQG